MYSGLIIRILTTVYFINKHHKFCIERLWFRIKLGVSTILLLVGHSLLVVNLLTSLGSMLERAFSISLYLLPISLQLQALCAQLT